MIQQTKALLEERHVRRAAIIDDAYDVEPAPDDIESGRWDRFFDDVALEPGTEDALRDTYGAEAYNTADVTALRRDARFVIAVWALRASSAAATELFSEFERLQERKRSDLHPLQVLLDELGVSYDLLGRAVTTQLTDTQIIFLDLFLGPDVSGPDGDTSVHAALDRVRAIVGPRRASPPTVILMSANPRVEELGRQLRDDAELLGCQFRIVRKRDLGDRPGMAERIYDLIAAYPDALKLNQFILSWDDALKDARVKFLRTIRSLDLADYANLQALTLEAERTQLGDYVIDLYDLLLHSIVESDERLIRSAKALNDIVARTPGQFMPPPEVVPMMDGAMFYHEVRTRVGREGAAAEDIRLGDVLLGPAATTPPAGAAESTTGQHDAYVVISQECDQQHRDVDRVLLLQGVAVPYSWRQHGKAKRTRPRTPVMLVADAKYMIEWNLLQPETWLMPEVTRRLTDGGYRVVRRFRTPFALSLQHAFTGGLSRVGTLAALPARFDAAVRVYVRTRSGDASLVVEAAATGEDAVCLVGRTEKSDLKEWLLLSDRFHAEFREKLGEIDGTTLPNAVVAARDDPEFYRALRAGLEFARDRDGFRPLKDTKHNIVQVLTSTRVTAREAWPQTVTALVAIEIDIE